MQDIHETEDNNVASDLLGQDVSAEALDAYMNNAHENPGQTSCFAALAALFASA